MLFIMFGQKIVSGTFLKKLLVKMRTFVANYRKILGSKEINSILKQKRNEPFRAILWLAAVLGFVILARKKQPDVFFGLQLY